MGISTESLYLQTVYPSNKDFSAFIGRSTPDLDRKEALLDVHLNNSRVIHSRLAWRPQILSDLATSMEETLVSAGYKAVDKWGVVNKDIEDEVSLAVL